MTCLRHLGTCMMVYSSRTKGFRTSSSSKYERKSRYIQNFQKYVMMYDKALEFYNLKINHLTLSYQMNFSIAFSAEKIYATPWTVAFSEYSLGKLKMEGLFFFIPIISEQRSVMWFCLLQSQIKLLLHTVILGLGWFLLFVHTLG